MRAASSILVEKISSAEWRELIVGERVPRFTKGAIRLVKGSLDFFGINQYTSTSIYDSGSTYQAVKDCNAGFAYERDGVPIGPRENSVWLHIIPWGMYKIVKYVKENFNNPTVFLTENSIEPALKKQLIISATLMSIGIAIVSWIGLPWSFTIYNFGAQKVVKNWELFFCVAVGLWTRLVIGLVTEYYTSNAYSPVQDIADSCRVGAATNVIFGLALGYKSIFIPIFATTVSIFVRFSLAAMYGFEVAAFGMLSTIATRLEIDAYGPMSDNAGGLAEMASMSHRIRERPDALVTAGNTTGTIGKGFAIGSAALVSLALFGAFVSRAALSTVDVLTPKVFIGLIVGTMRAEGRQCHPGLRADKYAAWGDVARFNTHSYIRL
ncbi:pyrophosphate-energized vacuolar membrane proton pump 1-like [Aristolochia californica]|uniref:pyrophosphate-energized vacuolar membrane proton pump 1-like n=1 Tax=Aristolochia californica TaxID=171875 RepID=UPI0035D85574